MSHPLSLLVNHSPGAILSSRGEPRGVSGFSRWGGMGWWVWSAGAEPPIHGRSAHACVSGDVRDGCAGLDSRDGGTSEAGLCLAGGDADSGVAEGVACGPVAGGGQPVGVLRVGPGGFDCVPRGEDLADALVDDVLGVVGQGAQVAEDGLPACTGVVDACGGGCI